MWFNFRPLIIQPLKQTIRCPGHLPTMHSPLAQSQTNPLFFSLSRRPGNTFRCLAILTVNPLPGWLHMPGRAYYSLHSQLPCQPLDNFMIHLTIEMICLTTIAKVIKSSVTHLAIALSSKGNSGPIVVID